MYFRIAVIIIIALSISACGHQRGYYGPSSYDGYIIADTTIAKQLPVIKDDIVVKLH